MEPFNLEEALSGKPVLLRGGQTAVVLYRIPDKYTSDDGQPPAFPLQGLILDAEGFVDVFGACWRDNGTYNHADSLYDIVGMWQEPVKSQEEILEEAWRNKGKVVKTDAVMITIVEVVGKTADGEYIVRNPCSGSLDEISVYGKLNWRPYEEPEDPMLNPKLATLRLPKPINPKERDNYWYIDRSDGKLLVRSSIYSSVFGLDRNRHKQGNCFSSESDAEAWINALDYARTGKVKIE